jgi:hypothetical protein
VNIIIAHTRTPVAVVKAIQEVEIAMMKNPKPKTHHFFFADIPVGNYADWIFQDDVGQLSKKYHQTEFCPGQANGAGEIERRIDHHKHEKYLQHEMSQEYKADITLSPKVGNGSEKSISS